MYWILGIIAACILLELLGRTIKDPSQYERDLENDSYHIAKDQQSHKGMKYTAWIMAILITIALISFFSSCAVLPRSTHYEYDYIRLWDGTTGHATDIVRYNIGDTIEEIPSGKKFVITGVGLPRGKMIHAQTKSEK